MWTIGIRYKQLLSIVSAMLKAEVAGIGFPDKGTPQGGTFPHCYQHRAKRIGLVDFQSVGEHTHEEKLWSYQDRQWRN